MSAAVVTPAQRRAIVGALLLVLLLSALDQTIVSTAMPRIIEQLQGLEFYSWVTTAYLLTSTVSVPIYGKLSDLYGRKPILVFGIVVFLLGSALCGLSGEFGSLPILGGAMTQLVVFRAIQGLGGGALFMSAFVIIADLFAPRERSKAMGIFGAAFGLASVIGPAIGGFFTDHGTVTMLGHEVAGWRWVFYVNLPLGLLALGVVIARLPQLHHGATGKIDFPGAALVILAFVPLLLALTLGGTKYPWDSNAVISLFALAAVAFVLFVIVELRTADPLVPLSMFRIRAVAASNMAGFFIGMAFFGIVMFMPLYMQVVQGINATNSGLAMLPMMGGLIVSSTVSGQLVSRLGYYKPFLVGGTLCLLVGVILLSRIGPDTTVLDLDLRLVVTGLGLGPTMSLFNMVVQNAVSTRETGVATSTFQFCRQIGSTVGVAVFGTLLTQHLMTDLRERVPALPGAPVVQKVDLGAAQSMAMNARMLDQRVEQVMTVRGDQIEQAYRGDADALRKVVADQQLPPEIRSELEAGGVQPAIHLRLEVLAATVEKGLLNGEAGRTALLEDATIPDDLKSQVAAVPERAMADRQAMSSLAARYRETILAQEPALVSATIDTRVAEVRAELKTASDQYIERIRRGTKEAFAHSVASTLAAAIVLIVLGLLIIMLIPEIPLRTRSLMEEGSVAA